jgi:hypothetical protein
MEREAMGHRAFRPRRCLTETAQAAFRAAPVTAAPAVSRFPRGEARA